MGRRIQVTVEEPVQVRGRASEIARKVLTWRFAYFGPDTSNDYIRYDGNETDPEVIIDERGLRAQFEDWLRRGAR